MEDGRAPSATGDAQLAAYTSQSSFTGLGGGDGGSASGGGETPRVVPSHHGSSSQQSARSHVSQSITATGGSIAGASDATAAAAMAAAAASPVRSGSASGAGGGLRSLSSNNRTASPATSSGRPFSALEQQAAALTAAGASSKPASPLATTGASTSDPPGGTTGTGGSSLSGIAQDAQRPDGRLQAAGPGRPTSRGSVQPSISSRVPSMADRQSDAPAAAAAAQAVAVTPGSPVPPLPLPPQDGVIGRIPKYRMPNTSSILPEYRNAEQEFIFRTFAAANYDQLRHIPGSIREQEVNAAREARRKATQTFLVPALHETLALRTPADASKKGLFSEFEYIPSRFTLADELASKARVASEAIRLTVGKGKEFTPVGVIRKLKHEGIIKETLPGMDSTWPYMGGAEEETEEMRQSLRWMNAEGNVQPPFVPPGTQKLPDTTASKHMAPQMMQHVRKIILSEWEGADLQLFENNHDCWVLRFDLSTIDSPSGLLAYMNVFVRCNTYAHEYRLNKVIEFWNSTPGDGFVYFVLRPPWVRPDLLQSFFVMHPEEKDWHTAFETGELRKDAAAEKIKLLEATSLPATAVGMARG